MHNLVELSDTTWWIFRYIADSNLVSVFAPLYENMVSSKKTEIHNILQCQKRTEPHPQVTQNSVSLVMWFLCYTSIQTERHARLQYCAVLLKAKWQHSSAHTHQFQLLCYSCCFFILIILCIGCLLFLCSLTSISKTETHLHCLSLVLHSTQIRYNRLVVLHTVEAFHTNAN